MTLACTCNNITVTIKNKIDSVSFANPWDNAIFSNESYVDIKFLQFASLEQRDCLHYKCLNCMDDVCCVKGHEIAVNPLLKDIKRTNRKYSEAFGLYLQNEQENKEEIDPAIGKILADKKQKYLDALFKSKEERIREFILQQEEIFDEQRRVLQEEYQMVKSEFSKYKKQIPEKSINEEDHQKKIKRVKTYDSLFPVQKPRGSEVFEFDEEMDNTLSDDQFSIETAPCPFIEDECVVDDFDIRPCKSVPVKKAMVELGLTESSFKDYIIHKERETNEISTPNRLFGL
ncbi:Uncharacterized protein QTN25_004265 [Entamoeba marina]